MLKLHLVYTLITGRQLDRSVHFWQPAIWLYFVGFIVFLLWQINVVVQSLTP